MTAAVTALSLSAPGPALGQDIRDDPFMTARVKKVLEFERSGAESRWSNPETGQKGVIRITRTYFLEPEKPCRDYVRTLERAEGEPQSIRGTGCRNDKGEWTLTEDSEPRRTVNRDSKGAPAAAPAPAPAPTAAAGAKAPAAGAAPAAATAAGKPADLKGAAPTAAKPAATAAAPKPEKKAAAKAAPPPPPEIPAKIPKRLPEWEAPRTDG